MEFLTYMFNDNKFVKKFGVVFILFFIVSFISLLFQSMNPLFNNTGFVGDSMLTVMLTRVFLLIFQIVTTVLSLIIYSYGFVCIKAIVPQENYFVLPFFNLKKIISYFFKLLALFIVCGAVLSILIFLSIIIYTVISSIFNTTAGNITASIFFIALMVFICLVFMRIVFIAPALSWIFANTENFSSFF